MGLERARVSVARGLHLRSARQDEEENVGYRMSDVNQHSGASMNVRMNALVTREHRHHLTWWLLRAHCVQQRNGLHF